MDQPSATRSRARTCLPGEGDGPCSGSELGLVAAAARRTWNNHPPASILRRSFLPTFIAVL